MTSQPRKSQNERPKLEPRTQDYNMTQDPIERYLHPACSPVFIRDYGLRARAEYRLGDVVTCEALMIKTPDEGWIIDHIETAFAWRHKGHAKALLRRVMELGIHKGNVDGDGRRAPASSRQ